MIPRKQPNTKLRSQFGNRVRSLRRSLNISQEELGFRTNLHRTYIGAIERGEQNVSLDNIGILAKHLKVEVRDLF